MATIFDGKATAAQIRAEVAEEALALRNQGIIPKIAVVLVGDDPASRVYAQSKQKAAEKLNIDFDFHNLAADTTEADLLALIAKLNADNSVHGVMIELPLPKHISKETVMEAVAPVKDVDGIHPTNRGYLLSGQDGLFPATPQSCIETLLRSGIKLGGKHVVLVGRGETVGKPLIFLALQQNATITVCHSRTADLGYHTRQADIVIAAVGSAKMIKADMLKPGAIVVDAGINELPEGGICGDVDFEACKEVAEFITPVPGGVGSLTTALIFKNVLKAVKLQVKK